MQETRTTRTTRTTRRMATFFSSNKFSATHFSKLPDELIFLIRSFNFDWAAKVIHEKAKDCIQKKIKEIRRRLTQQSPINNSVLYKNKVIDAKDILNIFSLCDCCERHQINKPKELKKWEDTPIHGPFYTNCHCTCRQLAREICRNCE